MLASLMEISRMMEKLSTCFSFLAHLSAEMLSFNADKVMNSYLSLAKLGCRLSRLVVFGRVFEFASLQCLG